MTVIVYRDGIMATDTAAWQYEALVGRNSKKIIRLPDGGLAAFCGRRGAILKAQNWFLEKGDKPAPEKDGEFFGLIVRPTGIYRVDWDFEPFEAEEADFHVCGADGLFLIGALAAGASAPAAVQLAIQFCDGAGGRVISERLPELP